MGEKSEFAYTIYGGWTAPEFVDFQLLFLGCLISGMFLAGLVWSATQSGSQHPGRSGVLGTKRAADLMTKCLNGLVIKARLAQFNLWLEESEW